ncbi:MAG: proton-conducting transporter membrane subunit, partial [Flavobacteriales bacterium]
GEQDVRKMGGLRKKLPITYFVFLIGTLAIAGVPPFAGSFSKDEILAHVWVQDKVLFAGLAIAAIMTAVYMFRLFFMTFYGAFRGTHEQEHHLHESPAVMTFPLIVLAVLSTVGGFLGIPELFGGTHLLDKYLEPLVSFPGAFINEHPSHGFEIAMISTTLVLLALIIFWVYNTVVKGGQVPSDDENSFSPVMKTLNKKFMVDELYHTLVVKPLRALGFVLSKVIEPSVIDGVVRSVNSGVHVAANNARRLQTGNVGFYIFAMVFGIIVVFLFNLMVR